MPDAGATAVFRLGQLDGALRHCPQAAQRIFAGRILRRLLISALRQEGHAFTDLRFQAWFAGLATLSDFLPRNARAPRAVCEAILGELAHSSWSDLATTAGQIRPALLAPSDLTVEHAHETAFDVVAEARAIARHADPGNSLFQSLDDLYRSLADSVTFAPAERAATSLSVSSRTGILAAGHAALPSPRWALDMFAGELLRRHALPFALPCPDLIRPDTLSVNDPVEAATLRAAQLGKVARTLFDELTDCTGSARRADKVLDLRNTSRAPLVFELLAGFGAMRSAQLETAVGASRLGVRSMLKALRSAGMIDQTKVAGAYLFDATRSSGAEQSARHTRPLPEFSTGALDEYEASLSEIDRLLASKRDR